MKRLLLITVALLTIPFTVLAQVTTSGITGSVMADGEEAIGATITAKHVPSGSVYRAVTNIEGQYTITGMKAGGPYEVEVSYIGFQTAKFSDVQLALGQNAVVDATLSEGSEMIQEIVVTAKANNTMRSDRSGAVTNLNANQMAAVPTIGRSMTDIMKMTPQSSSASGMAIGGGNYRQSFVTIDGASFNDSFGMEPTPLPGGGTPISIDALDQMTVSITPYDVRQSGFTGGGVNAVTKSGTNTFKGSAYTYLTSSSLKGNNVGSTTLPVADGHNSTYGLSFGGPIIKDKLFFFANAEMIKTPTVVNRWRGSVDGVAQYDNFISRTKLSDLQAVSDYVADRYGYNTGSYTNFPADEKNYKILARLDWNITDRHHLALRYNYTKNQIWNSPNASSMDGGTRMAHARMSDYSMSFANSMYSMDNLVHSFSLDLNSRLSDNLSNQFLATFSKLDDVRGTDSSEFPFIDITRDGDNYMALGYELFTWNNAVHNTIWNLKDDLTYYLGAHKITAGLMFEHQMADNQYMRNGTGYYRYNWAEGMSVADVFNQSPEVVCLTYGYDGESKPAARVQFNKAGIYAQDEWNVTNRFKLTYGTRIDGLFFNNGDLMTNNAILALNYYDADGNVRHIDTGKWPKNSITLSPRLGFTYDVFGDKTLKVRGGSGLFSGRLPLVFFTNMPTNGGLVQFQAQLNAKNTTMSEFAGGLVTDANGRATIEALQQKLFSMGYPQTVSPADGTVPSSISAVDPDFKMPQVWKSSIAIDYQLPVSFPFTATIEGIFNKTINAVSISDWSMMPAEGFARWNGADNRPVYPAAFRNGTKAFVLENTSKGYGWTGNITLTAQPAEWISLMAAYTHTVSKELTGMPGSAAESAFTYVPTVAGPNNIKLHNSQYVTPDRIVANATIHDKSGNHYSLIYETWRGGYNYSYMMANDMNGDGYNYDALYIPNDGQASYYENGAVQGSGQFRFASKDDMTRFMNYVHNDDYLKNHQGEYAEPYSLYNPWVHRIDFSYKHDFKLNVANTTHRLQLSLDVKNVLNLFNSSWGVSKGLNASLNDGRILKYERTDADGYPVFSTPSAVSGSTKTWAPIHSLGQCWYASVGIKYMFN